MLIYWRLRRFRMPPPEIDLAGVVSQTIQNDYLKVFGLAKRICELTPKVLHFPRGLSFIQLYSYTAICLDFDDVQSRPICVTF